MTDSPFLKFINSHPEYPNCSEANVLLFEFIRKGGNDFTSSDSFTNAWTAHREEIIEAVSSANAKRFLAECPAYPGGNLNAELMDAFIASQVGRERPWSVENYFAAFEYLQSEEKFVTEVEIIETKKKPKPIHPARALADAMAKRAAEEANLRKLSPIGKPVNKKLRNLAVQERRGNIKPNRLARQDKFPEAVI